MVGEVIGALRAIYVGGVPLAHCWFVSNTCRDGDSGAAVISQLTGNLLGQVVASRGAAVVGGGRSGTVVQDGELLLTTAAELLGCPHGSLGLSTLDPL
jgi:hypothetical protein